VPSLTVGDLDPHGPGYNVSLPTTEDRDGLARYLRGDRVLFWYLGGGRSAENLEKIAITAQAIRETDPQRPLAVDAWDGLWPYSRNVDMLGVHRWPLLTSLELDKYKDWLDQRRRLARPGTYTWTWVQTHIPEWYTHLVYDREPTAAFDEPVGPQPEQIRLLTFLSLASGCKGLGYWSDRFLADSHQGRDRLLAVALLNLEIDMLKPVLLSITRGPTWIDTSNPNVKAAVLNGDKGILVLPIWLGSSGQYVPGQSAISAVTMTVPMVPPSMVPIEVSPGDAHTLPSKRTRQGTEITIRDFSLTSAIVFTGDLAGSLQYFQEQNRKLGPSAAQFANELVRVESDKVRNVSLQLSKVAPPLTGRDDLLRDTDQRARIAGDYLKNQDYRSAYMEASRAMRPLRLLMRLQWEQAVKPLNGNPAASPYAVSYYTLAKQWAFQETIKRSVPGTNLLSGGGFEGQPDPSWTVRQTTLDDVVMRPRLSDLKPHEGKQCLELSITPKPIPAEPGKQPPPVRAPEALDRTFLAVTSPTVKLAPGSLVRISGWVRVPEPIKASADGVMFYDSIGGFELAVRLTGKTDWKQFMLYRRVPASGEVSLTMALTGLGTAQFDDVRIEPMLPVTETTAAKP